MKVVLPILSTLFLALQGVAVASVHVVQSTEPDHDRWMYPFNGTPGARAVGSTFTAYGSEYDFFDDRDGQMLLGFMTGESVPMGHGPSSYQVISATVSIMIESDFIIYDPSADGWETYLEGGPADADAGRATVISGAGFRGGYDGWSFKVDAYYDGYCYDSRGDGSRGDPSESVGRANPSTKLEPVS